MTKVTSPIPDDPPIPTIFGIESGRMSLFQRNRWFIAAAGFILLFAGVLRFAPKGAFLTAFSDLFGLAAMLAAAGLCVAGSFQRPSHERSFWALMTLGFLLWATNQAGWTYWEVILHRRIPDPFFFDIILFFHAVPMIAAVAWRPDLPRKEGRVVPSLLSFLMLLGWWVFLYAYVVFPHQYVLLNIDAYNVWYDRLYGLQNGLLLTVLGLAALTSSGGWRRLYLHFLGAGLVYGINSQLLDRAAADDSYYSGSLYDVPLIVTIAWGVATILSAREWDMQRQESGLHPRWRKLVPRLAMLAILSLPMLGLWTLFWDHSAPAPHAFRLFSVLAAMLLLGTFVFIRQFLQDQSLIQLLETSRRGYDSQSRLQTQLVQKEKLASLGALVAGAAHEINHPLTAIMNFSEQLWSKERLTDEQNSLLRKIVNQARRTRDLVTDLLSFAQQTPGEKILVDFRVLLHRATQMLDARRAAANIQIHVNVEPTLPRVQGNANQLFQTFVEIIENALDSLQEVGGGTLIITAQQLGGEVLLQFSDSGPGIREPQRVFDPFYTTKPVGKGTGLGLSAVYGVVQEHNGHISCQNKPEGGALFILRFPVAASSAPQAAMAAQI